MKTIVLKITLVLSVLVVNSAITHAKLPPANSPKKVHPSKNIQTTDVMRCIGRLMDYLQAKTEAAGFGFHNRDDYQLPAAKRTQFNRLFTKCSKLGDASEWIIKNPAQAKVLKDILLIEYSKISSANTDSKKLYRQYIGKVNKKFPIRNANLKEAPDKTSTGIQ